MLESVKKLFNGQYGLIASYWVFFLLISLIIVGVYLEFVFDELEGLGEIARGFITYFVTVPYLMVASYGVFNAAKDKPGFFTLLAKFQAGLVLGYCVLVSLVMVAVIFGYRPS